MSDHDEAVRLLGPWRPRTPRDAAALLEGYARPWWIAGGWAIEAFAGVPRPHDDVDPSILRSDVHELRRHLAGRLDVWQADSGTLTPVLDDSDSLTESWLRCERRLRRWLRCERSEPRNHGRRRRHTVRK